MVMLSLDSLSAPFSRVVWDWNGTLFNDAWLCVDVMNGILERHGLPLMTLERYQSIFGFPVSAYYEKLGFDFDQTPFAQLGTDFIRGYEERRLECDLHDGALQALNFFRDRGIPQTVLSAYQHDTLTSLLQHFRIYDYFEQVTGIDDHYAASKLDKGLEWLSRTTHAPQQILLIGDTLHDAEVAAAMGIQCVLLAGGNQHVDRLQDAGPPVYASLRAFIDLFQSLEAK